MASNYEVNIKLNTRTVNKQLNNLEKRISKLNKLAQGGKANRTVLRNEQEKIKKTGQRLGLENKILRQKKEQLKVDQQQLKVLQQQGNTRNRQGSGVGGGGGKAGGNRFATAGQSAIISGAFPLLFGQGPLVGGAGFIGGGLGALVGGQMGGFAGGLAATSIATPLQQLGIEAGKLGQALNPATKNVEALTAALGVTGTEFEKQLETLKNLGDEEAAFEATRQKMIDLVGSDGVDALSKFGQGMTELGNNFAKIMTLMKTSFALFVRNSGIGKFVAQGLERATLLKQAEVQGQNLDTPEGREAKLLLQTRKLTGQFGGLNPKDREELILNLTNQTKGSGLFGQINDKDVQKAREIVNDLIVKNQILINTKNAQKEADKMIETIQKSRIDNIDKEIELLERSFTMSSDEFEIEKQIMQMKEDGALKDEEAIRNKLKDLQILQEQKKVADEVAASFERMANTIATDIGNGIKGLINGTQRLNDVLFNVVNKLKDAVLNMAIFGNASGNVIKGEGLIGNLLSGFLANGGSAKAGKSYIVGEKGPELFTPGVSGMVTPNHALGGSTNVVVNVDASGSAVEGDDQNANKLGEVIAAAVQAEIVNQQMAGGLLS